MQQQKNEPLNNLTGEESLETLTRLAVPIPRTINQASHWRSAMMVSAHNLKHLRKIPVLETECVMLNLEDGVSPEQKPMALRLCALALSAFPQIDKKMVVRVNALDEGGIEEIAYLNPFMPDAIRIPKIRTAEDVKKALECIDENIEVHLSIETKEAWLNLSALKVDGRVKAFYLGVLDLFADLGLSQQLLTPENPTVHYLLSHFMITARALNVKPVSFVYQKHNNDEGLRRWLLLEKEIGLDAKGCISPSQVVLIHEIFGYSEEELKRCRYIVQVFEEHRNRGITGFADEQYGFIDEPIYKGALAVLNSL